MKKNKFVLVLQAVVATLSLSGLVSCGEKEPQTVNVKFDYNYENSPAATTVEVNYDDVVEEPSAPTRSHYKFTSWYEDAACTHKFDFEEAITEDVVVYAGWSQTEAVVTFDYNYTGSTSTESVVAINTTLSAPTAPTRDGFNFVDWYSDAACTTVYDFTTKVTSDMTLYASWAESTGNEVTLKFLWNYEGAPDNGVASTKTLEKGKKTTAYKATRDGYMLGGWYTDAACTTSYSFDGRINESATLYAKWIKGYTFEAEYTDLTGINGSTYSGGSGGTGLIKVEGKDSKNNLGASNGYWIADMYLENCTLTFNIEAAEAYTDAVLVLRLGAEYFDIVLNSSEYLIQVNGTNLSYSGINITNVPGYTTGEKKEFADYTISNSVSLNKGTNVIKLIVNNSRKMQESGTLNATAPMVDCLKIYANTELTWTPVTSNTKGK